MVKLLKQNTDLIILDHGQTSATDTVLYFQNYDQTSVINCQTFAVDMFVITTYVDWIHRFCMHAVDI